MRAAVVSALALALGGACTCARTPPEPEPPAPSVPAASPSAGAVGAVGAGVAGTLGAPGASAAPGVPSDRCVRLSPASPPPAAHAAPVAACPKDPGGVAPLAVRKIAFSEATPSPVELEAEVARTDAESERGLMYRTTMAQDHGMVFDLGARKEHVFWMHNTCIPLDMIFVDEDGLIVGILENVPTLNDDERTVGCPSTHVIETNAGWTRQHGVRAGQHVKVPSFG